METLKKPISVIEPVSEAIEKTKMLLFKPFDAEKWMVIGFCAWLANLIREGIRGTTRFNFRNPQATEETAKVIDFIRAHIIAISIFAGIAAIFFIALILVLLWLNSRGQFMFLDCLAKNRAKIIEPWKTFKKQANSLLGFRLIFIIVSYAAITALIAPIIFLVIAIKSAGFNILAVIALVFVLVLLAITAALFFGTIQALTFDFVVPIMYLQKIKIYSAWQKFLPILGTYFWKIMLYLLFKAVLMICIWSIIIGITFVGCCCLCGAGIILFIPYIGTVILLPLFSFVRLYTLCFLRQLGNELDVFQ